MPAHVDPATLTAAFAAERDARYALQLLASTGISARYTYWPVLSERGKVQMVMVEVRLDDPADASRVETCLTGAHGTMIAGGPSPVQALRAG